MGIEHVNRKGDRYFLQALPDRHGTIRYSFSRKLRGQAVDVIPPGFEIYESPADAQVFLRRKTAGSILPLEREMVRSAVKRLANVVDFIVDVQKNELVVYICEKDESDLEKRFAGLSGFPGFGMRDLARDMIKCSSYTKMMRFCLVDAGKRTFRVDRWCFKGRIDNWIPVSLSGPLADLAEEYAVHLGRESFFDLM